MKVILCNIRGHPKIVRISLKIVPKHFYTHKVILNSQVRFRLFQNSKAS